MINTTITFNPPLKITSYSSFPAQTKEYDSLEFSFMLNDVKKIAVAFCEELGFRRNIVVFEREEYNNWFLGGKPIEQLIYKLEDIIGMAPDGPSKFIQSFMVVQVAERDVYGPGAVLSGMLESIGIKSNEFCSCKKKAMFMNEQGPDWCEQNMDQILSWLEHEAKKRKMPFVRFFAKMLVKSAIKKSRKLLSYAREL